LEVYYTANNKKAYEQAARVLHDKVQGQGDYWNMALAMWQVLSPKRALFSTPAAGEEAAEPAAAKEGGGIVNITGEGEATTGTGLDLDLDTTGGGGEGATLEVEAAEAEADVLDVTAAIATADSEVLDVTAAVDTKSKGRVEEEEIVATAAEEEGLDFSLDLDEEKGTEEGESLESSLDLLQPEDETTASPAKNIDDDALEFSLELGEPEEKEEMEAGELELDMSLDYGAEPVMEVSHTGSSLLDVTSSVDTGIDVEDLSRTGAALLDVTSASSIDTGATGAGQEAAVEAGDSMMDVSMPGPARGADMLDVTAATDFDLETGKDLLDLTSAGVMVDTEKAEEGALDFELAPDEPATGAESPIAFEGIDLTADTSTPAAGLELELESSPESAEEAFAMDMDSTMQIPSKRSTLSGPAEEDVTFKVSRTSGGAQSDEDEIATQLDLAKAYIELGNADSAKTILGEIIAVGNAEQRQQAQELLGQIA
ncbi:MAG: FimV/HubP family polar landmark protein, partial [Gammaproteobacteria bacterium]